ncbi:NAD(P)-binding protein [Plenodomus tracheiphilus IPT5]|uniref:NAD(P)-binding protein n=1 Tax=Plenodomus tracheiphilus IPT5 TaxID=1408161 RepID=A0A6A7B2M4_9PLEO|nr:NAD(P)-binding protein [Plenodomus tracheiphilus IPT5]
MPPLTLFLSFCNSLIRALFTLLFARLYTPQSHSVGNLFGQTAIVTGANSGIGLSIAVALAKQGATVCLACRSLERGLAAVKEVVSRAGSGNGKSVFCWQVDVGDLGSVRKFCERWVEEGKKVDMLVHNAGIADVPAGARNTDEKGRDVIYVTNFLGSFLMTRLLEGQLSDSARVVFTSSTGSYSGNTVVRTEPALQRDSSVLLPSRLSGLLKKVVSYVQKRLGISTSSAPAYAKSKAQQVLFAHLLQRHFSITQGNRRSAHAFTPGFTSTPIFRKFDVSWRTWLSNPLFAMLKVSEKWVAVDTDEGAKTGAWLASRGNEVEGGGFWEWGCRRMSLVDLLKGVSGEARWEKACEREWNEWEVDAGVVWERHT